MTADLRITRLERCGDTYALAFQSRSRERFDEAVAALKNLPPSTRLFDPDEKCWFVRPSMIRQLAIQIPELAAYLAEENDEPRSTQARDELPTDVREAFTALHLLPSAPAEVVAAAYRALSKSAHPDAGGSHDAMKRLSAARAIVDGWRTQPQRRRRGVA